MLLCLRARSLVLYQIAFGIREDHVTHGLMVLDIAGAAADVPVEGFRDGFLQLGAWHRFLCKTLQQDLALIQEAGGAISTLECEVLDEGFLQDGELAILRVTFDGADCLAVKAYRRYDAGRASVACAIGIIDDDSAAQALRYATAELGTGHPEVFAQEIVHREIV